MGSLTYKSNNQKSGTGYSYDGNGNPTTYAGTSLGFDLESRLTSIGSSWSAGYRPDGLRGSKTVSSTATYFLYDGAVPVMELDGSGNVKAINVFGADGLVGRLVPGSGGSNTQYLFDHQGNVAQRLDGSGSVISKSTYDAYGAESSTSTPTDPFGYNAQSGYYLDRETGLHLCTFRYYDPVKGRWITRDPISYAGGMNLYGYCGGGPVSWTDPLGLNQVSVGAAILMNPWMYLWHGGGDMDFSGEAIVKGLQESGAGALTVLTNTAAEIYNLSDAGRISALIGGSAHGWDGGDWKNEPGWAETTKCWDTAQYALSAIVGAKGAQPKIYTYAGRRGGVGANITIRGNGIIRAEIQEWKPGQPKWQYPHLHIPSNNPRHFPWDFFLPK